jgi:hypothetical protein
LVSKRLYTAVPVARPRATAGKPITSKYTCRSARMPLDAWVGRMTHDPQKKNICRQYIRAV